MSRRIRCLAAVALLAAQALGQAQENLLVVVVDDLGPEFVGCYRQGANPASTPTLDTLAAKGVRFANAYANPVCTPTRACLMTGRHAFRSGMETTCMPGDPGLQDAEWILPEALGSVGYQCALIGKWHLGDRHGTATPNIQGWPHFVGALYGNIPNYTQWQKTSNGVSIQATTYATTDQVDEALSWIRSRSSPWMLMLNFHAPHTPLHAPPSHLHRQRLTGLSPAAHPLPFYKAMVEAMDTELGRLLAGIGSGLARTNIFVISDNGAPVGISSAAPGRAKGSLYEAGIRVPFLAQGPVVAQAGRVVQDRVHAVDVFATLWELAAGSVATPAVALDGTSLVPLLRGSPMPQRAVYSETIGTGFGSGCQRISGDYKLIRFSDDPVMLPHEEFYRISSDPTEAIDLIQHGLSASEQMAYQSLSNELWQLRPRGYIEAIGSDCPTTAGSVRLKSYAPPSLGVMHHMRVLSPGVGPNLSLFHAVVYLGLDVTSWGAITLPAALDSVGMPGCSLRVRPDAVAYSGPTDSLFALPTPTSTALLGAVVHAQAFVADGAANQAGLAASAHYRFTLGLW